ncbi:Protein FAM210B [Habropoda laboriosa]|uniref:Protein FAM210B n=2 Tax=Habropoda laboriosa TaxID=597456 RepID=A0A0L7QM12_9HYME|nr:Protein FAM210B [Habropoda laboriosa]
MQYTRYAVIPQNRMKNLHVTSIRGYPDPPTLPLPTNVSEIFANETGRFSPERLRDIAAPVLLHGKNDCKSFFSEQLTKSPEHSCRLENSNDTHVDSYDCFGAVSLNSTMQTNVPKPFCSNGKSTYLNMPGGQWARDGKYIAEDMQKSHYRSIRISQLKLDKNGLANHVATNILLQTIYKPSYTYIMAYSTKVAPPLNNLTNSDDKKEVISNEYISKKERFKKLVKDYGITATIFHIGISLISLGACYTAVASGIDLEPIVKMFVSSKYEDAQSFLSNSSTFLIAYGIHKVMMPIRLTITVTVLPLLVRKLRKVGVIKPIK